MTAHGRIDAGGELVVLDGSTFFVSAGDGDVEARGPNGFFFQDMRHLSRWRLRVGGSSLRALASQNLTYYGCRVVGMPSGDDGQTPSISIRRDRFVSGGIHEDLYVCNSAHTAASVEVELSFGADFADIMTVRSDVPRTWRPTAVVERDRVMLSFEDGGHSRGTEVLFTQEPSKLGEDRALFSLHVPALSTWQT